MVFITKKPKPYFGLGFSVSTKNEFPQNNYCRKSHLIVIWLSLSCPETINDSE